MNQRSIFYLLCLCMLFSCNKQEKVPEAVIGNAIRNSPELSRIAALKAAIYRAQGQFFHDHAAGTKKAVREEYAAFKETTMVNQSLNLATAEQLCEQELIKLYQTLVIKGGFTREAFSKTYARELALKLQPVLFPSHH